MIQLETFALIFHGVQALTAILRYRLPEEIYIPGIGAGGFDIGEESQIPPRVPYHKI